MVIAAVAMAVSGCQLLGLDAPQVDTPRPKNEAVASIDNAQSSLDFFFDELRHRRGDKFYAKVSLPGLAGRPEDIWVSQVVAKGDKVTGNLAQAPRKIPGARKGSKVKFSKAQVLDWMIVKDGKVYGAFTGRPKL